MAGQHGVAAVNSGAAPGLCLHVLLGFMPRNALLLRILRDCGLRVPGQVPPGAPRRLIRRRLRFSPAPRGGRAVLVTQAQDLAVRSVRSLLSLNQFIEGVSHERILSRYD